MTLAALLAATTLRLVLERKSLTATWRTYHQYIDGVEVVGSAVIERDGAPSSRRLAERRLASAAAGRVYVLVDGEARPARRVVDRTAIHYLDDTGKEIRTESVVWNAKARVFNPNPVAKLNDPSLRDQNNAASAVPDAAYDVVDLLDLAPSGMLAGPNVAIVDTEAPFTAHADASQPLMFDRSQPQFEEVNAYFHIDRTQRYIQSLGYTGDRRIVGYAIPVDPHAANGADNSFYAGGNANGMGQLFFGDGGTNDAQDSDIMLHEFGHAIQDWIDPGVFGGPPQQQSRALGEGFGDYWSFSQNYAGTLPSGRDEFCIADWDARCFGDDPSQNCGYPAGADCLRRVDSAKTMADYTSAPVSGSEYRNGEIWSSALREIFMTLVQQNGVEAGRRIADTIVLEGTFGVPPDPTFNVMARKLLDADRSLYGGAHAATICGAMTKRGIITTADCNVMPRGELTIVQSSDHGLPISSGGTTATLLVTDTRPVDRLLVRVDVEHPSRGDLRLTLIAPDGTTRTLFAPSLDRLPDIHATFGSDVEPIETLTIFNGKSIAGLWQLVVTDTHGNNVGRLVSWSLVVKFAGDEPVTSRPPATQHIVAVAHANGLDGAQWRSDLFLFNKGSSTATATIIFTPSGANGTTTFGAVNVDVAPGEVAVFRDVVAQLFNTDGLGTLAIGGDVQAWSRTVDTARGFAEVIEAAPAADAVGVNDLAQYTVMLFTFEPFHANVGAIETAGQPGTVRFTAFTIFGTLFSRDVDIAPYSHVQFGLPGVPSDQFVTPYVQIAVVAGGARVHGYGSVIKPGSDSWFVKAQQLRAGTFAAAVVGRVRGSSGTAWTTTRFWQTVSPFPATFARETIYDSFGQVVYTGTSNGGGFSTYPITGVRASGIFELPAGWALWLRNSSETFGGDESSGVPVAEALGDGDSANAIRIEHDAAFRTNVGAAEVTGGSVALRFTLFDNGGKILGSVFRLVGPHQQLQLSLNELSTSPVLDGRVHVEVLGGDGHAIAYASVVNNATTDSEFVRAR